MAFSFRCTTQTSVEQGIANGVKRDNRQAPAMRQVVRPATRLHQCLRELLDISRSPVALLAQFPRAPCGIALTKSLGKETAGKNIAVNCITPAAARTRLFDQMSQEHIDFMLSRIPRGRFLEVDEVSAMVAWLVSEENSFTTAAVFDLSGGRATY